MKASKLMINFENNFPSKSEVKKKDKNIFELNNYPQMY
jgi:hypothetical protein